MNSPATNSGQRPFGPESDHRSISIVTASYNAIEGLKRTVDDIEQQIEAGPCEHIVIDGGSTDGTREYLASLGGQIRWVSEPDDGIADALNKGVAMATGDWILVLQADDRFIHPQSLASAIPHLSSKADIVAFEVQLDRGAGQIDRRRARRFGIWSEFKMNCPHQGMFVRRELYRRIGGFDQSFRIAMDFEWLLRARRAGARLKTVAMPVAVMPATGVSTRLDWPSIKARLDEDRRLMARHARNRGHAYVQRMFWAAYLPYKRLRSR